jgi:hypothetical protein
MPYIASQPGTYAGRSVGSGQCVAFVQIAASAPLTAQWRRGSKVRGNFALPAGSAIATFDETGRYANSTSGESHAAIYMSQDASGLHVWDQWSGQPVHQREIRFRGGSGKAVNDGDRYFVIEPRANALPEGRITLQQFLDFTGWGTPALPGTMQMALEFFQDVVPQDDLRAIDDDPGFYALPSGGPFYCLTRWMQSFDFSHPVQRVYLPPGRLLKAFVAPSAGQRLGHYFTSGRTPSGALAIPRDQTVPRWFVVQYLAPALAGTVSDAYVDWARQRGIDPEYRRGSGDQFFIWDPAFHLRRTESPAA